MSVTLSLFAALIDSSGVQIGYTLNGFMLMPYSSAQTGIMMQDSAGVYWLLQINTDGSLNVSQVTL